MLILKLEKISNKSSERFLEFEVYEPINMTKLNLSLCNDISIDIYIPVKLSEEMIELYNSLKDSGYDLFDINSKFYTDFCTPYTSPDGTDILLSDRVNYIFNNQAQKTIFDLSSDEFDEACKKAVAERNAEPVTDYVTRFDATTGKVMKAFANGRVEYVLD